MQRSSIIKYLAVFSLLFPIAGLAQTTSSFDEQVRQALLRNPEIILEVFAILENEKKAEAAASDQQIISQYSAQIFGELDSQSEIILVEFSDYQCGYCRQAAPVIESILTDNPNIQFRLIELPILGEKSREYAAKMLAVKALYGDEIYMELHDLFIGGRGGELQNFDVVIARQGLSPQLVYDKSLSDEVAAVIAENLALANNMGISGTPGFVTRSSIIRGFVQKPVLLQALSGS